MAMAPDECSSNGSDMCDRGNYVTIDDCYCAFKRQLSLLEDTYN